MFIHSHHLNDQRDIVYSAASQRPPNDLGQRRGAVACSQTKHNTDDVESSSTWDTSAASHHSTTV